MQIVDKKFYVHEFVPEPGFQRLGIFPFLLCCLVPICTFGYHSGTEIGVKNEKNYVRHTSIKLGSGERIG
jgi:hypothetical protein